MGVLMPTVFSVKQILEYFVYFVFQIQSRISILYFRPQVEVFDKSISNTFLKSILYLNTSKKVSFTTLYITAGRTDSAAY